VIDADRLAQFIEVTPVLCHVTPAANVARIEAEGLRPGSDIRVITRDDFFSTRPAHVYLVGQREIPIVEIEGEPRVFAVDLAMLDPARINPDEDMVAERFPDMVSVSPPHREMNGAVEASGQRGARARWAEETPGFDRGGVTERSLFEGRRIAYRGTIPPGALTLLNTVSTVLEAFGSTLSADVSAVLPGLPLAGGWRVEIARSRAIASESLRGILRALGCDVDVQAGGPEHAQATCERLRLVIRELQQGEARFAEAETLIAGQDAIEATERLCGDAPLSDLQTAAEVSTLAASAVNVFACLARIDKDRASQVALDAYRAALRVGTAA
jgi:hypothetical protein